MPFLDDLDARGLVADVTDRKGLAELLASQIVPVYAGYDPTSASLHLGNLVPTILLKRFQLAGHRPIVLVGGATGMIGDPSGRSAERNLMDDDTIAANLAGIRGQLSRLLDFDDPKLGAIMVNNIDWTRGVSYLEFLRDIGKHLTVNYMLAKDSVGSRLEGESGISYTEFSYMLLQAFDFVQLQKLHGCRLQVGGSDQYGNITAGCELQHKLRGPRLFGLTAPLLLDPSGAKMGKTSTGERIWLDAELTSPYAFYQYWLNRQDDETPQLLRMFSLRSLGELDELLREHDRDRSQRTAQRELARTMTTWIHGAEVVARVEAASRVMFGDSLDGITDADLDVLAGTVPTVDVPRSELVAGVGIIELLTRTIADSKGAARRLITQGGAYINNQRVTEVEHQVTLAHLATETMLFVRGGKKSYCLVRVT
ncbi:MAG: tyrosine--tRNA ligase [Deltaproteobacteria bacterium]|nr:MAG: tyrosine--tRNA ligase [Deltaproteobacteria bacterium]TMQ16212.1 MAG: tyrosine--tRNA ligase [Deltaproteobacteria bacterium]